MIHIAIASAITWIAWYTWRFIWTPIFHPHEPKELPYLVPVVGHMWRMMTDSQKLFSSAKHSLGNTFIVTTMGESMYIVTAPEDVKMIYKMPKLLDLNPFIKESLATWEICQQTIQRMFQETDRGSNTWMGVTHDNFKAQLHPGDKLNTLQIDLLERVNNYVNFERINDSVIIPELSSYEEKVVPLYRWCQQVMIEATSRAIFDDALWNIDSEFLSHFIVSETEGWKRQLQFPKFAARGFYSSKRHLDKVFVKYLLLPKTQRANESWIVSRLDESLRDLDIGLVDRAQVMLSFFQLTNTNVYKLCFWLMTYILFDETLLRRIADEIESSFQSDGSLKLDFLLESCPLLNSTYEECLRVVNYPVGPRTVTKSMVLNSKHLRPGRKLLMMYRQMHFNPEIFGSSVDQFDPERFLRNPALSKSSSFRPFGGGATYCPGRFLARREVLMFVALALKRFDITLCGPDGHMTVFPKMDDSMPSGGVLVPEKENGLCIKLRCKVT